LSQENSGFFKAFQGPDSGP